MTEAHIQQLAARIALWRRADISTAEFVKRVACALREVAPEPPLVTRFLTPTERAARDAEIALVMNSRTRKFGDIEVLAERYRLDRRTLHRIAARARDASQSASPT